MLPLTVPVSCAGGGVTLGASATKLRVFVESVKLVPVLPPPPPPPPQAASNRQADTAYGCRTIAAKGCMAESPSKRGSATKPPFLVFQLTSTHIKLRRGNRRPEPSLLAGPSRNVDALQMRILCSERIGLAMVASSCERDGLRAVPLECAWIEQPVLFLTLQPSHVTPVLPSHVEQRVRDLAQRSDPHRVHEDGEDVLVVDHGLPKPLKHGSGFLLVHLLELGEALQLRLPFFFGRADQLDLLWHRRPAWIAEGVDADDRIRAVVLPVLEIGRAH